MPTLDRQVAYSRQQAADVTGYSKKIIDAAVRSGDLVETYPTVNGKQLLRGVILRQHLEEWLTAGGSS